MAYAGNDFWPGYNGSSGSAYGPTSGGWGYNTDPGGSYDTGSSPSQETVDAVAARAAEVWSRDPWASKMMTRQVQRQVENVIKEEFSNCGWDYDLETNTVSLQPHLVSLYGENGKTGTPY